jgi:hypothetical protein
MVFIGVDVHPDGRLPSQVQHGNASQAAFVEGKFQKQAVGGYIFVSSCPTLPAWKIFAFYAPT